MAMLAEPRRKQKWTLNPRGKHWSEDSNKFGQKMLEKMGWSSGKGLGANLDGMTDHIRLRYKNDQAGIGFSHDDVDKQWTQHQEGFNELLQKLHNGDVSETITKDNELSGKSLELKSKQSRARVHYRKFTRGKDVNKYSSKDLANIFGKKDLEEKSETPETKVEIKVEIEEPIPDPIGSSDTSHGVMTIKGGSIADYFKNKMPNLGKKFISNDRNESESDSERHVGFGFSSVKVEDEATKSDKSIKPKDFHVENSVPDMKRVKKEKHSNFEGPEELKETLRKPKIEYVFDNPSLDLSSPKKENVTPRKRKNDFVFENPCLELESSQLEVERTPKRRKNGFAFDNGGLDLHTTSNSSPIPTIEKKNRKKKSKDNSRVSEGFTNEALHLEHVRDDEISSISQFEVSRSLLGVSNGALDLADETSGKKRVTFNETVEYQSDVAKAIKKKNKNSVKLDKFEVDNEKLKKKRKKSKMLVKESVFINEAMDEEIINQEANDNASNERKSERARKKRERRTSNLETIAEAPEEDKDNSPEVVTLDESLIGDASEDLEVLTLETPKKKNKKKKKKKKESKETMDSREQNDLDETIDISEDIDEIPSESSKVEKKSKKDIKREPEVVTIDETQQTIEKKNKKRKTSMVVCDPDEEMDVVNLAEAVIVNKEKGKKNASVVESTSMNKENVEISATEDAEVSKKSKKRSKARKSLENEYTGEKIEQKIDDDTADMQNGSQSPFDGKVKKSKKIFKALFARSPVVHFAGSNINEIKGYGMDI